jgi:hypothetical protein
MIFLFSQQEAAPFIELKPTHKYLKLGISLQPLTPKLPDKKAMDEMIQKAPLIERKVVLSSFLISSITRVRVPAFHG